MKRVEQFLNERGRQIIGWDEILEGDVAPNATVMSWRGMQGGIEAAKLKHDVIMTPNDYVYFDYYQSADKEQEPMAMGSCITVEKVYNFEPVADELADEEKTYSWCSGKCLDRIYWYTGACGIYDGSAYGSFGGSAMDDAGEEELSGILKPFR